MAETTAIPTSRLESEKVNRSWWFGWRTQQQLTIHPPPWPTQRKYFLFLSLEESTIKISCAVWHHCANFSYFQSLPCHTTTFFLGRLSWKASRDAQPKKSRRQTDTQHHWPSDSRVYDNSRTLGTVLCPSAHHLQIWSHKFIWGGRGCTRALCLLRSLQVLNYFHQEQHKHPLLSSFFNICQYMLTWHLFFWTVTSITNWCEHRIPIGS